MNPDNSEVDLPHVVHPFRIFPVIFHLEFPFSSKKEREREKEGKKKVLKNLFFSPHAIHSTLSCLVLLPSDHSIFLFHFFLFPIFNFIFLFFFIPFFHRSDNILSFPDFSLPFFLPPPFLILYFLPHHPPPSLYYLLLPRSSSPDFFFLSSFSPLVHIPPPYSLPFSTT